MDRFAYWPPIFWTLRIGIVIVLSSGFCVYLLLVSRFFRLKTMRAMLLADPPRVESLGGEFGGAKAEVKLSKQVDEEQVAALREQVRRMQDQLDRLSAPLLEDGEKK
jgi:hypothetical protein